MAGYAMMNYYVCAAIFMTLFVVTFGDHGPKGDGAGNEEITIYTDDNSTSEDTGCRLLAFDETYRAQLSVLLESGKGLLELDLLFPNHSANHNMSLFQDPDRMYFKPWHWVRTTGRPGQALLMLPFYYREFSFGMLALGTGKMNITVIDEPQSCFRDLDFEERVQITRTALLNDFSADKSGGSLSENQYVCLQDLRDHHGYGDFVYDCCRYGPDGNRICIDLRHNFWVKLLIGILTSIKIIVFLFCPLLLPAGFYTAKYILDRYRVDLPDGCKPNMTIFVSEGGDSLKIPYKGKITAKELGAYPKLTKAVEDQSLIPREQKVQLTLERLTLRVQRKRLVSKSDVPVSLIAFLFNNFVRCRVRRNVPFNTCCKASIFGTCIWSKFPKITWLKCTMTLMKIFLLLIAPFPFYIRLYYYYSYEKEELRLKKEALEIRDLSETFLGNIMQFLSPAHALFVLIYLIFIVEGIGTSLLSADMKQRFKFILRQSLRDMRAISYPDKIAIGAKYFFWPLEKYGLFGFIVGILYWPVVIPLILAAGCFYFIPMIYVTFRVIYSFVVIVHELQVRGGVAPKSKAIDKITGDKFDSHREEMGARDFLPGAAHAGQTQRLRKRHMAWEIMIQIFILISTIATIYATTIILVEVVGFFVEIIAFTIMGIIVNAGQTMKYVSLVFLLWLYMHDCFKSVNDTYVALATSIIEEAKGRVDNLEDVAALSATEQGNMGFFIKLRNGDPGSIRTPFINSEHKLPRWNIARPLLLLDSNDTPYVSLKLFEEFCKTTTAGCPGPIYANLLRAAKQFMTMVAFLGFVLIVVMTFGNAASVSGNNQMLATVVGGMLPFLLRNFIFGKKAALSLSPFSFKFLFNDIAAAYEKNWMISDFEVKKYEEDPDDEKPAHLFNDEHLYGEGKDNDLLFRLSIIEPDSQTASADVDILVDLSPDTKVEIIHKECEDIIRDVGNGEAAGETEAMRIV